MADSTVIREYLVALGFKVNGAEAKKGEESLDKWDRQAKQLGRSLLGVGVATAAMVTSFTYQMEKLYYASKRTDSAAGSIKALEYGASKVGVSGDRMRASLESMARNIRANPGLIGLLNSLGVRVSGRDKADVFTDLVGQLRKMPFYVAQQYGSLFGTDADDLFLLQEGIDEMRKAQELRKQMAAEMGVDADAAALAGKNMANEWRNVVERAGLFRDVLATAILPQMMELSRYTQDTLTSWSKLVSMDRTKFWDDLRDGLFAEKVGRVTLTKDAQDRLASDRTGAAAGYGGVELSEESKRRLGMAPKEGTADKYFVRRYYELFMRKMGAKGFQQPDADAASVDAATDVPFQRQMSSAELTQALRERLGSRGAGQAGSSDAAALFARLERQYALPPGILDRVWQRESSRGQNMLSPAGAQGHMGFMPPTARQYGVQDPNDLTQSATAAAKYYADLLSKYGGDPRKAAAAYNWGPGNLDRYGLGSAPKETRDYMDAVAGPSVNQTNNITVSGVSEPDRAARAVGDEMREVNADTFRNFTPRVQ